MKKKYQEQIVSPDYVQVTANIDFKWVTDQTYHYQHGLEYTVTTSLYNQLKRYFTLVADIRATEAETIDETEEKKENEVIDYE